jgi:hypothetical protein
MRYLVQLNTAARAYLAPIRSGVIVPLFPPHLATARQLIETPTAGQLADILKF